MGSLQNALVSFPEARLEDYVFSLYLLLLIPLPLLKPEREAPPPGYLSTSPWLCFTTHSTSLLFSSLDFPAGRGCALCFLHPQCLATVSIR